MDPAGTATLVVTLALVGSVIVTASLLSGLVERSGVPQVAIFLGLGLAVGPYGLALIDFGLDSPTLRVIATLALVLVLFVDAVSVDIGEIGAQRRLATVVLGPGTLVPAALLTLAAWWLLDLSPAAAAILGASLASTDPVLLRALLRHPRLPGSARLALRLESGMNDAVLLPVVVVAMLLIAPAAPANDVATGAAHGAGIGRHLVGLFVLGPLLGVAVGWIAITALDRVRSRIGVRRDYESLYALGVALSAFAAAEAAGGSGFLAAFAAGLVIAALDVELCDCFVDYGEASSEMFLLLTFVAFGASLIWSGLSVADLPTLAFAVLALTVRTAVMIPVLRTTGMDRRSRRLTAWFGPRGLSSLLLVLLPVFAGTPGAGRLFSITCLVVLMSLVLHGALIAFYLRGNERDTGGPADDVDTAPTAAAPERVAAPAATVRAPRAALPLAAGSEGAETEWITIDELRERWAAERPVVVADARTDRNLRGDPRSPRGAVRIPPDESASAAERLRLPRDATIAVLCA